MVYINEIELKLITHGERIISVNKSEYEDAKANNVLDHFLDWQLSDISRDTIIVEVETGEIVEPYK